MQADGSAITYPYLASCAQANKGALSKLFRKEY